jgi:hypothetical protein
MSMLPTSSLVGRPTPMCGAHGPTLRGRRALRRARVAGLVVALAAALPGCSPDSVLGNTPLPPDVPDPAQTQTPAGAMAAYRGALVQFQEAFGTRSNSFVPVAGVITDELQAGNAGLIGSTNPVQLMDSRSMPEEPASGQVFTTIYATSVDGLYGWLQRARGQAQQARGALRAYAPDSSPAYTAHLDAIEGYAEVLLADLFCSGVPLSTLDFNGDFTYRPGSTTEQVYRHAATLFDSALVLAAGAGNDRILDLARVGKGRALLALGEYAEAGAAVAAVPNDFQYALAYSTTVSPGVGPAQPKNTNFVWDDFRSAGAALPLTMVDSEGTNGLAYLSSGDPRTAWVANGTNSFGLPLTRPAKYSTDGDSPIVVASGIEARLIQAEAQLNGAAAGDWLATLNTLRTNGTFTRVDTIVDHVDTTDVGGTPQVDTTYRYDTLWVAGTGGVAHLGPLSDPGTAGARVDLLFRERAYWLFLTGHRQGDLRRLVRNYGRDPETVYPTGAYPGANGTYGLDVTAPIPSSERNNPRFNGCLNRGA